MPLVMPAPVVVFLALLLLAAPTAAGGDEGEIDPDRPDLTNSARPVGRGVIQLETGLEYARTRLAASPAQRRLAVQATLRFGLTDSLEGRLDGEPLVRLRGAEEDEGLGDLTVGLKYRVLESPPGSAWPTVGLLPFVKLPTAQSPIGSAEPDGGLIGLASFALPADFDLDLNAGVTALGQKDSGGVLLQALLSASLSHALTKRLRGFAEFFFRTREERQGDEQAGLHAGLLYLVTPSVALDASVLTSVLGPAPDYAVRAGVSLRFDR